MKTILFSLITLLFFSCTHKNNINLEEFSETYYQWHRKYAPNYNFTYQSSDSLNKTYIGNNYYNDIKRFSIELNQINPKNLSTYNYHTFHLLNKHISLEIFKDEKLKINKWNLIDRLDNIFNHLSYLLILSNYNKINSDDLNNELEYINLDIQNLMGGIEYKYRDTKKIELANQRIDDILNVAERYHRIYFNAGLYVGNDHLLSKNNQLSQLHDTASKLKSWYYSMYPKFDNLPENMISEFYPKYLNLSLNNPNNSNNLDSILLDANNSIKNYFDEIFDLSLTIYLIENDEPIWTDIDDSISVINWSLDSLKNSTYDCADPIKITNHISNIFSNEISKEYNLNVDDISFIHAIEPEVTDVNKNLFSKNDKTIIAINYNIQNNLYLYYNILSILNPGDLFVREIIYSDDNLANKIYVNQNYLNGFSIILVENYINNLVDNTNRFKICDLSNSNNYNWLKILFYLDRINDSLQTIAHINYYLHGTSVETTISEFDYIVQLDIINIDNYLSEIYSLKLNSIIKFNSYNIIKKMQKNQQNIDVSIREIIKLLEANPNNNLNKIRNKLIN